MHIEVIFPQTCKIIKVPYSFFREKKVIVIAAQKNHDKIYCIENVRDKFSMKIRKNSITVISHFSD